MTIEKLINQLRRFFFNVVICVLLKSYLASIYNFILK